MKEVKLKGFQCEKCSYVWLPKKGLSKRRPKVCPKCKNHNWDSPRKLVSDKKKEQDLSFKDERRFR
jgi:predicted Zn-ribbon and HTH transcriptional regulator